MSVYSQYGIGTSSMGSNIIADESYSGAEGAFRMIEEAAQNEHAIFEQIINQDFAEAYNKINPTIVSESQLESIQEANAKGIWNRIVEFIKKIGEKIMGIIKTLRDRIQSVFIRDGKELVKKYEKQINVKIARGAFTKMKFKYAKPKNGDAIVNSTLEAKIGKGQMQQYLTKFSNIFTATIKADVKMTTDEDKNNTEWDADRFKDNVNLKPYTEDEKTGMLEEALTDIVGTATTAKDFAKDFDESVFGDVDEIEGYSESMNKTIKENLTKAQSKLKTLSDDEKKTKSYINQLERKANEAQKTATTAMSKGEISTNIGFANGVASKVNSCLSIYSRVSGLYYSALGTAIKKDLKQCRAIYIKAATYNQKQSVEDQAILLTVVGESSDYEVDEMFDNTALV